MKILFKPRPNGISWETKTVDNKFFILYQTVNREEMRNYVCYKRENEWDNGQYIRDFDSIKQAQDWLTENIDIIK